MMVLDLVAQIYYFSYCSGRIQYTLKVAFSMVKISPTTGARISMPYVFRYHFVVRVLPVLASIVDLSSLIARCIEFMQYGLIILLWSFFVQMCFNALCSSIFSLVMLQYGEKSVFAFDVVFFFLPVTTQILFSDLRIALAIRCNVSSLVSRECFWFRCHVIWLCFRYLAESVYKKRRRI